MLAIGPMPAVDGCEPKRIAVSFDPHFLDPEAIKIVQRLVRFGHEAYLVGGCVRDLILGERPKDFDVVTSARPNEIRKIFRNCRIIGRRFRLAHIFFPNQKIIEVATFRGYEVPKSEEQKSEVVLITDDNVFGDARSDATRRDFPMNGLFYDLNSGEIIDYVGGFADLRERTISSIGDPVVRFREDPVRMIRAIKFAAKLRLTMTPDVRSAIEHCHKEIINASPARVVDEVFKILGQKGVYQTFVGLQEHGLLKFILEFLDTDFRQKNPDTKNHYWNFLKSLDLTLSEEKLDLSKEFFPHFSHDVPLAPIDIQKPSRALQFLLLISPLLYEDLLAMVRRKTDGHFKQNLQEKIQDIATGLRIPRKEAYAAKQMIMNFERLCKGSGLEPGAGGFAFKRVQKFSRRPHFLESLQYLWLCGISYSELAAWQAYDSWDRFRLQKPREEIHAPGRDGQWGPRPHQGDGTGEFKRRRRRRRGGRGRQGPRPQSTSPTPQEE